MKRLISILLSGVLLCNPVVSTEAIAESITEENGAFCGKCGDNVFWEYDGKDSLRVFGNGPMWGSFPMANDDWSDSVRTLGIEEGVTYICDYAFENFHNLESISIPGSVETIRYLAFGRCSSLKEVVIPEGVRYIDRCAFAGCENMTSISLPDSLTSIGTGAFDGCALSEIMIPKNVSEIKGNILGACGNLKSITVDPDNAFFCVVNDALYTKTMDRMISYCVAKNETVFSYEIPDTVEYIEDSVFQFCTLLTDIHLPASLNYIGSFAFLNCTGLTSVSIPDGTYYFDHAFQDCSGLTEVYIPNTVNKITDSLFTCCDNIKTVYFGGSEEEYQGLKDGVPFEHAQIVCNSDIPSDECIRIYDKEKVSHIIAPENSPEAIVQRQSAQIYSTDLARALVLLSSGAYDYEMAQDNLAALGMTDVYFNDDVYKLSAEEEALYYALQDKVGFGIGCKTMESGEQLVLVVVRGSFGEHRLTGNEWLSNYNIVMQECLGFGEHVGFQNAEKEVLVELKRMLNGIPTSNIKYVVTGHSRGAAVANLLEKDLMDAGVSGENVFGYNFACPDVAKALPSTFNPDGKYNNIFNIGMAGDPVSIIPGMTGNGLSLVTSRGPVSSIINSFTQWGKYGTSGWFCRDWNSYEETGLDFTFGKHKVENYIDMMARRLPFSCTKSWIGYKASVLISMMNGSDEEQSDEPVEVQLGKSTYEVPFEKNRDFNDAICKKRECMLAVCCPVDVEIVNSEGVVLASVIGDEVTYSDNAANDLKVLVMKDGDEKYFTVIGNEDYHFNLTGTDTGEMTAIISVQPACMLQSPTVTYYENVPLTAGKQMSLDVSSDMTEYGDSMTVYDESGAPAETIVPDIAEQSQIYGDLNQDNDLTVADAVLLARMIAEDADVDVSEDAFFLSDVNRDGILSSADTAALLNLLTCKLPDEQ